MLSISLSVCILQLTYNSSARIWKPLTLYTILRILYITVYSFMTTLWQLNVHMLPEKQTLRTKDRYNHIVRPCDVIH